MPARRTRRTPSIKSFGALCERWGMPPPSLTPDAINYIAQGLSRESRLIKRRIGSGQSRRECATTVRFLISLRNIVQEHNSGDSDASNAEHTGGDSQEGAGGPLTADNLASERTALDDASVRGHEYVDDNHEGINDYDSSSIVVTNGEDSEGNVPQLTVLPGNTFEAGVTAQSGMSERVQASIRTFSTRELELMVLVLQAVADSVGSMCNALDCLLSLPDHLRAHLLGIYLPTIAEQLMRLLSDLHPQHTGEWGSSISASQSPGERSG